MRRRLPEGGGGVISWRWAQLEWTHASRIADVTTNNFFYQEAFFFTSTDCAEVESLQSSFLARGTLSGMVEE